MDDELHKYVESLLRLVASTSQQSPRRPMTPTSCSSTTRAFSVACGSNGPERTPDSHNLRGGLGSRRCAAIARSCAHHAEAPADPRPRLARARSARLRRIGLCSASRPVVHSTLCSAWSSVASAQRPARGTRALEHATSHTRHRDRSHSRGGRGRRCRAPHETGRRPRRARNPAADGGDLTPSPHKATHPVLIVRGMSSMQSASGAVRASAST